MAVRYSYAPVIGRAIPTRTSPENQKITRAYEANAYAPMYLLSAGAASGFYLYNLASIRLKAFLDKHGHLLGQLVEETAEELFFRYLDIIDGIRASTE
jgi:hypothetical protein